MTELGRHSCELEFGIVGFGDDRRDRDSKGDRASARVKSVGPLPICRRCSLAASASKGGRLSRRIRTTTSFSEVQHIVQCWHRGHSLAPVNCESALGAEAVHDPSSRDSEDGTGKRQTRRPGTEASAKLSWLEQQCSSLWLKSLGKRIVCIARRLVFLLHIFQGYTLSLSAANMYCNLPPRAVTSG